MNSLQQLTDVLQTQKTLGATLATIAEAATMSVAGRDAATIAISIGGHPATAAMTATVASSSTWCNTTTMTVRA